MDDATQLQPMSHRHLVVVKSEPQESEDTANIIDQHEVNTESSDQPLEDCLIQPNIEISVDRDLFHLQTKSEKNPAFYCSHIGEGSGNEESNAIKPHQDAIEIKPQTIGETGFFYILIKSDHHTEPSQNIYPLNNSPVPPGDLLYSCELCSYQGNKRNLACHKSRYHSSSRFQCNHCVFNSTYKSCLMKHMLQHSSEKRYRCKKCDCIYKSRLELTIHRRTHPVEGPHICEVCVLSCVSKSSLTEHMLSHSSATTIQPEEDLIGIQERIIQAKIISDVPVQYEVNTEVTSKDNDQHVEISQDTYPVNNIRNPPIYLLYSCELAIHERTHEVDGPHICEICAQVCLSGSSLTLHMLNHSSIVSNQPEEDFIRKQERLILAETVIGIPEQSEDIAEIPSKDKDQHTEPIQNTEPLSHSLVPPREFACKHCTFKSKSNGSLKRHMSTHTTVKKQFQCIHCGYTCNVKQDIDIHITSTHSGERPFACGECSFMAASSSELTLHKKVHSITRTLFKCTECDFTTNLKGNFEVHLRTHSGERPYACDDCSYKAATSAKLNGHKIVHSTTKKLYKCSLCDFKSCYQRELDNHVGMHVEKNPYACDICSYVGGASSILRQHKRKYH